MNRPPAPEVTRAERNGMKIKGENLKVGDVMETRWMGHPSTIKRFHEYHGPFEFVCKIAEFLDGSKMSIDRDRYYECVD